MISGLLIAALITPLQFEIGHLEIHDDHWSATHGLRVIRGARWLSADRGERRLTPDCAEGRWLLDGAVRLGGPEMEASARRVEACLPRHRVIAHGLRLAAPGMRLGAERASVDGARVEAEGLWATACACDTPPWKITAAAADLTLGVGGWMRWPVFWAGPVPVATAPWWYVPHSRRRTGLLLPTLGYDGEDGVHGGLPVFMTLGRSVDLTLTPGWRQTRGASGEGRLRWAASETEGGAITARSLLTEGVAIAGEGSVPLGGARLAVSGGTSTDATTRRVLFPGLAARGLDHLAGRASLSVAGRRAGVGIRATRLLVDDTPVVSPTPDLWLRWRAPVGPGDLHLHGRTLTLVGGGRRQTLADLGAAADATLWLGPLRLRPEAGGATVVHLDDGDGQASGAWTGLEARLAAARRFGALRHTLALALDGRAARGVRDARALLPLDRPLDSRALGATLETRLAWAASDLGLSLRLGYEGEAPVEGVEAPALRLWADGPAARLSAGLAGADAAWLHGRVGDPEALHGTAGLTRLRLRAASPTLRTTQRPLQLGAAAPDLTTAEAGLGLPLGPLRLRYAVVLDAEAPALLGQRGALRWSGRCDCWHLEAHGSHERGRRAPDVWLSLSLGAD